MRRETGFTLVELMVVITIIGILSATAFTFYRTLQRLSYGKEAVSMMKQILNAQIIYFLENETFFPSEPDGNAKTYIINHSGQIWPGDEDEINAIRQALNITIPVGHFLDFTITGSSIDCQVNIQSTQQSFPLFKNGDPYLIGRVDRNGKTDIPLD